MRWLIVILLLLIAGCVTAIDPVTGEEVRILDPNVADAAEAVVTGTANVLSTGVAGPVGAGIAGILVGILGAWRKVRPSLEEKTVAASRYRDVSFALVSALEEFKGTNPEDWIKLKAVLGERLAKLGISQEVAENIIRGLRGLPAKT